MNFELRKHLSLEKCILSKFATAIAHTDNGPILPQSYAREHLSQMMMIPISLVIAPRQLNANSNEDHGHESYELDLPQVGVTITWKGFTISTGTQIILANQILLVEKPVSVCSKSIDPHEFPRKSSNSDERAAPVVKQRTDPPTHNHRCTTPQESSKNVYAGTQTARKKHGSFAKFKIRRSFCCVQKRNVATEI